MTLSKSRSKGQKLSNALVIGVNTAFAFATTFFARSTNSFGSNSNSNRVEIVVEIVIVIVIIVIVVVIVAGAVAVATKAATEAEVTKKKKKKEKKSESVTSRRRGADDVCDYKRRRRSKRKKETAKDSIVKRKIKNPLVRALVIKLPFSNWTGASDRRGSFTSVERLDDVPSIKAKKSSSR
ncbi:hypothetical protein HZH68_001777 [Vespula germanica]|uniref:Transmembrane protein n=1 Tax=Vespula germanica TaxID=30212 RepID=A0A834NWS4_VESGE|nr:hypothetical protein HZH68_001777 [Vespula germanica]